MYTCDHEHPNQVCALRLVILNHDALRKHQLYRLDRYDWPVKQDRKEGFTALTNTPPRYCACNTGKEFKSTPNKRRQSVHETWGFVFGLLEYGVINSPLQIHLCRTEKQWCLLSLKTKQAAK